MSPDNSSIVISTYRNLRLGMIALIAMLAVSVIYSAVTYRSPSHSEFMGSISAYFYTSAHMVFIGSLCALGALLVTYKGSTEPEDVLLNYSGFLAFLIAFIPATVPDSAHDPDVLFPCFPIDATLKNAVLAAMIAGGIAQVLGLIVKAIGKSKYDSYQTVFTFTVRKRKWFTTGFFAWVFRLLGVAVVVVLVVLYAVEVRSAPPAIHEWMHNIAAIATFSGLGLVVASNAFLRAANTAAEPTSRRAQFRALVKGLSALYTGLALAMVVTVIFLIIAFVRHLGHLIILGESAALLIFAAAWIAQTIELWNIGPRQIETDAVILAAGSPESDSADVSAQP
ncbi:hypothetical protein ACWDPV_01735 [Gordonia sp. NPDC003504]